MKENADYLKEQKGKRLGFSFWLVFLKSAVCVIFMLVTLLSSFRKGSKNSKRERTWDL